MSFEEFQDGRHGGHLGYQNRTILAILNLNVATMPPTKFQLNPTYGSGDVKNVKSSRQKDGQMDDGRTDGDLEQKESWTSTFIILVRTLSIAYIAFSVLHTFLL